MVMVKTAALWVMGALCLVGPMMAPASIMAMTVEEMMADPALEARARDISQQVRCLVCQNQSIDDSDAELAQDLRREIRQHAPFILHSTSYIPTLACSCS